MIFKMTASVHIHVHALFAILSRIDISPMSAVLRRDVLQREKLLAEDQQDFEVCIGMV